MLEQLEFSIIEPRGSDHVYFGFAPEVRAAKLIDGSTQRLRRVFGWRGRPVPTECLHLSLHRLGDRPSERLLAIADAAAGVVAGMSPFDVTFDRVVSFRSGDSHPQVLLCSEGDNELRAFHWALARAIRQVSPCQYKWAQFVPHITVFYNRRQEREFDIEPVSWTVRDFVLIHSLVGQARHVRLGQWPLRGAA